MKILIVGLKSNPQLKRVMEEAEKRGHKVDGVYSSELVINSSVDGFRPHLRGKSLEAYDVIYIWAVGKRRWEWYTACYYLNKKNGAKIINQKVIDPSYNYYLSPAHDYLKQTENDLPFPRSAIIFSSRSVDSVVNDFTFPVIVKTSSGRQGRGVFKVGDKKELVQKIDELKDESSSFVVREFIPNDGDIRVFTVGYKAIGAMKRTPPTGDFRSNISQGGSGSEFDLSKRPEVRDIAEKLSKIMRTEIAGVDVMLHKDTGDPYILEINPGPQFMGLEKYTSTNAALEIVKYFEKVLENEKR